MAVERLAAVARALERVWMAARVVLALLQGRLRAPPNRSVVEPRTWLAAAARGHCGFTVDDGSRQCPIYYYYYTDGYV